MNELSHETSPYLLQHAQNPVHWKAWNPNSLSEARDKNKLLIISVGYSACHWCHVMEHETFEDDQAAKTMNDSFVNIKVDREERPDVDAVYMKAIQIMTGRGGWPLNIVALPDGRPVWGGTYFKKEEWIETLEHLQKLYGSNPEKMIEYAEKLHEALESISKPIPPIKKNNSKSTFDKIILENLLSKWSKSFDHDFGGMARAPKFMMPNNYKFLLRYAYQFKDYDLLDFVNLTLTKMVWGGIFDTVGGGFSRYSVDMKWHVPHFEKMLYDNGQLVSLYADAYKLTKNPLYKEVIEKTLKWISTDLTNPENGFYSALDADSLDQNQHLEEGAFYVWRKEELQHLLNNDFNLFADVFNCNTFGYWEDGNYVLIQNQPLDEIASRHKITVAELQVKKKYWEQLLFNERKKRSAPRLDDKTLTSWNAIMLIGYVDAYKALQDENYLISAIKNADFLINNLWSSEGNLWRTYKNGKSSINAYLEDYAFIIKAFSSLYEVTFDEKWLQHCKQLTDYCFEHFFDPTSGFFTFVSDADNELITRHFETEDNVIPSSNSVMAENLLHLSIYFGNSYYEEVAMNMISKIIPTIDYPSAFSNWLTAYLSLSSQNRELAIVGTTAIDYAKNINQHYFPHVILAGSLTESSLPFLKNRFLIEKTVFYLCESKTCDLPTEDYDKIIKQITT